MLSDILSGIYTDFSLLVEAVGDRGRGPADWQRGIVVEVRQGTQAAAAGDPG